MLVILLTYYLARLVWALVPAGDEVLWVPPASVANARANAPAADYGSIAAVHLFGAAAADETPAVVETEDAPETRLNLELRAAVAASDEHVAHAIIADGNGNEQVYFIKNSIPGGATLHRVQPDRVILNRGGVLETLRLPREFQGQSDGRTAARATATRRAPPATNMQNVLTANAATFTEIVRPQPFMPNGQLKGYRVFPGRNRQQFMALGLRPGDLVTAINGVELNNPAQGMEIFRSLGESNQVNVTIERGGQQQQLTLDVGQLSEAAGNTR